MTMRLILLTFLWAGWCLLHSLLITPAVTAAARRHWGRGFAWYRLGYNLFSLLTLLPLWFYTRQLSAGKGLWWDWPYTLIQVGLVLTGLGLLWAGARVYDLRLFAGFKQIVDLRAPEEEKPVLKRNGVLGVIRHPWYSGALCLLWSQKMDGPTGVMTAVLSVYLVVGAFLEERKLVRIFGEEYRDYQQKVSMFIPVKRIGGLARR
jgi:protein-S-isoprenylcysteine O-methyltransferase Ste14